VKRQGLVWFSSTFLLASPPTPRTFWCGFPACTNAHRHSEIGVAGGGQALSENSGASLGYGFPLGEGSKDGSSAGRDASSDVKENPSAKGALNESPIAA
jgi:hypothetical protein